MEKVAIEYGDGLYELARDEKITDELLTQAIGLRKLLRENGEYTALMRSRSVEKAEKDELLKKAFEGRVHARGRRVAVLEASHILLPFLLSRQCGEPCHRPVPIEVHRRFHDHHQARSEDVDVHFQDAHFADSRKNFRPRLALAVPFPVLANQRRLILQIHRLHVPLHRHYKLPHYVSFCHSFFYII